MSRVNSAVDQIISCGKDWCTRGEGGPSSRKHGQTVGALLSATWGGSGFEYVAKCISETKEKAMSTFKTGAGGSALNRHGSSLGAGDIGSKYDVFLPKLSSSTL